jgi:hypothetical protein
MAEALAAFWLKINEMRDEHREIPPDGRWQAGRKMRAYKHKQEIST